MRLNRQKQNLLSDVLQTNIDSRHCRADLGLKQFMQSMYKYVFRCSCLCIISGALVSEVWNMC